MQSILTVTNQTSKVRPLWIEPEGADFWMAPEQTFELRVEATEVGGHFELWDQGDSLVVFPASASVGYIAVFSAGQELECGYQRPAEGPSAAA